MLLSSLPSQLKQVPQLLPLCASIPSFSFSKIPFASYLLKQCKSLIDAKRTHQQIVARGLADPLTTTHLVGTYIACDSPSHALAVLERLPPSPSAVFWWNALIKRDARLGFLDGVFRLYLRMRRLGWKPDGYTYPFVLKACGELPSFRRGTSVHAVACAEGFESNVYVCNAMVAMYGRCGALDDAQQMFDELSRRDIHDLVSWNSIVSAYVQNGNPRTALEMFDRMNLDSSFRFCADAVSLVNILPACASVGDCLRGKQVHGYAVRNNHFQDLFVGNAILDICEEALSLFEKMREGNIELNVVTWSAVIAGYAQRGHGHEALNVFRKMRLCGSEPNVVTLVSLLSGCASVGALLQGKETHCYSIKHIFDLHSTDPGDELMLINGLIDMYSKCKSTKVARTMFDSTVPKKRSVVTWTVMIGGYCQQGDANDALELFSSLLNQDNHVMPNAFTISCALMACARLAALRFGLCQYAEYLETLWYEYDVLARFDLL
ncbi:hypothetical protein U1Q18_037950 [Sarracenia purpurea var. burkii]